MNNNVTPSGSISALAASNGTALAEGRPMSAVIRERIVAAGRRFHANDNIADFVHSGKRSARR